MAFPVVATSASSGGTGPRAVTKPASLAVGDLMIGAVDAAAFSSNNASIAPPSGAWTTVFTRISSASAQYAVYYKFADSADVAASTFTFGDGDRVAAAVLRITGADPTTPIVASSEATSGTTTLSTPSVSPAVQSLFIGIGMALFGNNSSLTITNFATANSNPSWTADVSSQGSSDTSNQARLSISHANETGNAGSATGAITATSTLSSANDMVFLAIQPPTFVSDFFGAVFGVFQPIVPAILGSLFGATFTMLQATANTIANTWTYPNKNDSNSWNYTPKP